MRSRGALVALAVLAIFASSALHANARGPAEELEDTVAQVMAVIRDPALGAKTKEERVKEILGERLDYEKSAEMALGIHVRANRARMGELVPLFRKLLEKLYISRLVGEAGDARITVTGERISGDYATVEAEIAVKQNTWKTALRLRKTDRGWLAYDVYVEGVSMIANYRAQFNAILSKHSFDTLLERLREKAEE